MERLWECNQKWPLIVLRVFILLGMFSQLFQSNGLLIKGSKHYRFHSMHYGVLVAFTTCNIFRTAHISNSVKCWKNINFGNYSSLLCLIYHSNFTINPTIYTADSTAILDRFNPVQMPVGFNRKVWLNTSLGINEMEISGNLHLCTSLPIGILFFSLYLLRTMMMSLIIVSLMDLKKPSTLHILNKCL